MPGAIGSKQRIAHPFAPLHLRPSVKRSLSVRGARPASNSHRREAEPANTCQRCVQPTSATHVSKASTRASPGFRQSLHCPSALRITSRRALCPLPTSPFPAIDREAHAENRSSDAPVTGQWRNDPPIHPARDCFSRRLVKSGGVHSPERLPPVSDPSRVLRNEPAGSKLSTLVRLFRSTRWRLGPRPPTRPQPSWLL